MSRRCPNCDQHLLEDEQTCWQCGYRLGPAPDNLAAPPSAGAASLSAETRADSPRADSPRPDSSLIIYGAVSLCVVLFAIFFTFFLGRQPRVETSTVTVPEGWVIMADRQRNFSVFLPQEWPVLDANSEADELARALSEREVYAMATHPLGGFVEDEEVIFLARGSRPSTFLLVAISPILNRLSLAEAARLAREGDVLVRDARQIENLGAWQTAISVVLEAAGEADTHCEQRFIGGEQTALLLALCAPPGQLTAETSETILSSVQRLRH